MTPQKSTRCACGRHFSDATGAEVHPEVANPVGFCVCSECRAKANAATLAAWKRLTADEKAGSKTETERGGA